eukprot:9873290-Karenia_brevis.AAC.1
MLRQHTLMRSAKVLIHASPVLFDADGSASSAHLKDSNSKTLRNSHDYDASYGHPPPTGGDAAGQ